MKRVARCVHCGMVAYLRCSAEGCALPLCNGCAKSAPRGVLCGSHELLRKREEKDAVR